MRTVSGSKSPVLYLLGILTLLLCPTSLHGCSSPPRIKHGHFRYTNTGLSLTDVVEYECQEGYILVGEAKITCTFFKWSAPAPQCKALCLKPEITNGKLSVEKAQYVNPEAVTIKCDPGFRIVGSQNISCSENKSWSPDVPKCEKVGTKGCKKVFEGQNLLQCLPNPLNSKVALELYKLSLEIEKLEGEINKEEIA
ncbi:C4b-binding protein alpha chain-like [Hippopotamus amphibius kiboko]|uniref:C4b-binding protein alpha chain-like n=1 Tax=Hippopotamus amphibius kiboko TaxID=575201 RepID=UPI002596F60D|nr:C4b-binding protein alpha chain-like [Hippopotamus amphibius kiboko]